MSATHEMIMTGKTSGGVEEWLCIECGRHFLLSWPPRYKKLILTEGDDNVTHVGAKGGIKVGPVTVLSGVPDEDKSWLQANGITWD